MNILISHPAWINYFTTVSISGFLKFHVTIFVMIRNRRSELTDPIPARRCTNTHVVAGVSAQQAGEGHADCHDCQNHQKFVINCIFLSYWQYHLELFSKFKFFKKIFLLVFLWICGNNLGRLFVPLIKGTYYTTIHINYRQH